MQYLVKPHCKGILFDDFKNGCIRGVCRQWNCKKLKRKPCKKKFHYSRRKKGKKRFSFYFKGYDKFYYRKYAFIREYGYYSLSYCYHKYRDDYVFLTLKHGAIKHKTKEAIRTDCLMLLESVGINLKFLEIEDKLNRIDYKHDFEFEINPAAERQALLCILKICRDAYNGVYKENSKKGIGIKYKPKSSYIELIVYDKENERKDRLKRKKRTSQVELELQEFKNVFRTELRLGSKRLNYNKKNIVKKDKTLENYYKEEVADYLFQRYVEPIFYTEPFYRLDITLQLIKTDSRLTDREKEKLCKLVTDINRKGFTKAKEEYNYCNDIFDKHIKLLRSIGINPLCFDEDIEITMLHNFTTKKVCRDFSLYDEEVKPSKKKVYDEWGFEIE